MIPIPKSAPFAEEEIALLNRVMGPASPVQRAWLAGLPSLPNVEKGDSENVMPGFGEDCVPNQHVCEKKCSKEIPLQVSLEGFHCRLVYTPTQKEKAAWE